MPRRADIVELLRKRGFRARSSLGQNFLVDANFLSAIVREAGISRRDGVIEIGTGPGNLTEQLAERAGRVWSFEIDPALHAIAREVVGERENVTLVEGDGAEFARRVEPEGRTMKVVSNLPYREYHRLVLRLLAAPFAVESYTLMIQRDAFDRIRAKPGTKEYGPLAALVQWTCSIKMLRRAGPALFHPRPRVESVLIRLERHKAVDFDRFDACLRGLFAQRRKKFGRRLRELGITDPNLLALSDKRVEQLAPEQLALTCGVSDAGRVKVKT